MVPTRPSSSPAPGSSHGPRCPWLVVMFMVFSVVLLSLTSCSSSLEYRYYDLALDAPDRDAQQAPGTVVIQPMQVAVAYNSVKMVYRVSPYEVKYDTLSNWVGKPGHVVQDAIYRYYERRGTFRAVTTGVSPPPDMRLDGYVEVLEEDVSGATGRARLMIRLELRDTRNGKEIWIGTLEGEEPLEAQGGPFTAAGLSSILRRELDRVTPEILRAIDAYSASAEAP